jgi:hypothetical protein
MQAKVRVFNLTNLNLKWKRVNSILNENKWRGWFQNAINAKSKISELTTPWCYTNKVL